VFSTMTYTFVIASLFGSVCLTQPVTEITTLTTVEQVYKVDGHHKTEYYQPVYYVDMPADTNTNVTTTPSLYITLLNES